MQRGEYRNKKTGGLFYQLRKTDQEILNLLLKRTELLEKSLKKGQTERSLVLDPELEKGLWRAWQSSLEESGIEDGVMRKVFHLLNNLAYSRKERAYGSMLELRAKHGPAQISLKGGLDCKQVRMWLTLCAVENLQTVLGSVILNDQVIELSKALNQAGANISWEEDKLWVNPGPGLDFNQKSIFVGQDKFNFYLLAMAAAKVPGRCKFTGGMDLNTADLDDFIHLADFLGARAVSLVPGSSALPLRLESSGVVKPRINIGEKTPLDLIQALGLALSWFAGAEGDEELSWSEQAGFNETLIRVQELLEASGCEVQSDSGYFKVSPKKERRLQKPNIELDAFLVPYLLAFPLAMGGKVSLEGDYPLHWPEAELAADLLKASGLKLSIEQGKIWTELGELRQGELRLEEPAFQELKPLILALGILHKGEARLNWRDEETGLQAEEIMSRLGLEFECSSEQFIIPPQNWTEDSCKVKAGNEYWAAALGLISSARGKVQLLNPGIMTRAWPKYWRLYRGLPKPDLRMELKREEENEQGKRKKRRRILE